MSQGWVGVHDVQTPCPWWRTGAGDIVPSRGIHSDVFLGTSVGPGKQRAGKLLFALGEFLRRVSGRY